MLLMTNRQPEAFPLLRDGAFVRLLGLRRLH
jgi:hypothetical protein